MIGSPHPAALDANPRGTAWHARTRVQPSCVWTRDQSTDLGLVALTRRPDSTALAGATACFAVSVIAGFWAYVWLSEMISFGKSQLDLVQGLAAVAVTPAALLAMLAFGRTALSVLRFREHGIDVACFGRAWRSIPYDECNAVEVKLVRHVHGGIQPGTTIKMRFTAPQRRPIRWRCRYKEPPRILGVQLNLPAYRDGDTLDEVLAGLAREVQPRAV